MAETIIASLQLYLTDCPLFEESGLVPNVNYLDPYPESYGIFAIPGEKILAEYVAGGGVYEFPFELQVNASNADDLARLQTQGFFERFGDWLDERNSQDVLPVLGTGKQAMEVKSLGQGYLLDAGESNVSTYAVPCRLTYEKR